MSESIQRYRNGGIFNFNNGSQDIIVTVNGTFAWAVRSGDIGASAVPFTN